MEPASQDVYFDVPGVASVRWVEDGQLARAYAKALRLAREAIEELSLVAHRARQSPSR